MTHSLEPESNSNKTGIEPPAGEPTRTAQPAVGAADDGSPPLITWGESQLIGHDEATGERAYIIPTGRDGEVQLIPMPAPGANPYSAITDWLNFTFPLSTLGLNLDQLFALFKNALRPVFFPITQRAGGKYRYDMSFALGDTRAIFACGGNRGTALLSLTGEACALIDDWQKLVELGRETLKGRVTRWDGAVDDYLGLHSVDEAAELYQQGKFGTGGNKSRMRQHGNWLCPDGRGRSIEIGDRENGKRLQVYEKGMQLGTKWHPWVRWEVLLGNVGRVVPWEVLLEPGRYVVGAYPKALHWVQAEMSRIATLQKQQKIGYRALTHWARQAYGKHVRYMREVEGSDAKVIEMLSRSGLPARLDHPARPKIVSDSD